MIRVLNRLPKGAPTGWHVSAVYIETGSFPWYIEMGGAHKTQEEAWDEAVAWARDYQRRDPFGNMANAFGVIVLPDGKWRGVVNYYHSNT